jgi:predicted alpha/beta-fold hydrolase
MFSMFSKLSNELSGHLWTVGPKLKNAVFPDKPPPSTAWRREVDRVGDEPVYVTGQFRDYTDTDTLVIVVHGLGGCEDSDYVISAANHVEEAGYASLRLSLRGADRSGDDLYHGGLYEDIAAAVTAPRFEDIDRIFVVGYSLGGHIALRAGLEIDAELIDGIAAVCSPLDLGRSQQEIDTPKRRPYRMYLLHELRQMYRSFAERHSPPTPVERIEMVRTLREWDALTVVPRFEFDDVDDYYQRASVAGRLQELDIPSLLVATRNDPLVFHTAIDSGLPADAEHFEVNWLHTGGHVFFPPNVDLGYGGPRGLIPQILTWLDQQA